ncbi:MAG: hypothetical protein R3E82_07105 [Pseudomonadales bacterium]|nr:hypothetical protein [Pseudomonadales bacterium]
MKDFDIELLYAELDQKRVLLGLTWKGVAKEIEHRFAKVSPSTIAGLRGRKIVEGDGVLQMLLWLERAPESFVPGIKPERKHQLVEPKNAVLRFDVRKTYRLLDAKRLEEALTWEDLADQIGGFSAGALQRFGRGGRTAFPGIVRIARWLGIAVKELTGEYPG